MKMHSHTTLLFAFAISGLLMGLAHSDETTLEPSQVSRNASERPHVTVKLWPRSEWDPETTYRPARVIATMGVRVCDTNVGSGTCKEYRDAWSTVVSRDDYLHPRIDRLQETLEDIYYFADLVSPHICELYRTYDNLTYLEVPLTLDENRVVRGRIAPLHLEDEVLIHKARTFAKLNHENVAVVRLERGHMWKVPSDHWNFGERGLAGRVEALKTEWIGEGEKDGTGHPNDETTNTDERPIYYE